MVAPHLHRRAREKNWEGALARRLPSRGVERQMLEQKLQGELDLPWIVWIVSGRTNFAESGSGGSVRIIRGASNGHHAVAAKARRVKVGMVENIEDFRSELQLALLAERKVLED